jgi:glucose/arabinose dehydrogenase
MKLSVLVSMLILFSGFQFEIRSQIIIGTTEVDTSSIVTNLDTPWDLLWGPDDHLWFTETYGRISRVDPENGEQTELIIIDEVHEVSESGLLGMVLHPDFFNHPYVYVVYTYLESSNIMERLVRYTYSEGALDSPLVLIEGIPGASTHDGSRLVIDSELKLYMTTGDARNTSLPQDVNSLNGKVLRLNLDGSVPDDNPISGSYVWSWGHRNAQGLVISPAGIMYSSEHGPSSDDEVNIIEKGRNYGWPTVMGYCDTDAESQFCADSNVVEPIAAWTPTLAVAGLDFYRNGGITHWHNSLLITSLKESELTVLRLSEDGRSVIQEETYFDNWFGRLRDVCISPDGRVFLAVSNRDGRGSVREGDDRIMEISSLNSDLFCYGEHDVYLCEGEVYDFNGVELSQPGHYADTIAQTGSCDSIISLQLFIHAAADIGIEDTVTLALNESTTLTANEGFVSYTWNNGVPSDENSVTVLASDFGLGVHDYVVEVESVNGCMQADTITLIVLSSTGLDETELGSISVYPNPFGAEGFQMEYAVSDEIVIMVYDQAGRNVYRNILIPSKNLERINFTGEAGVYNLVLESKGITRSLKLLKL